MPNQSLTILFPGVDDLKKFLAPDTLAKNIQLGVGQATIGLHSLLSFEIAKRYNAEPLNSVRVGSRITSVRTTGVNTIESGLTYRYKAVDLSKFPRSSVDGPSEETYFKSPYNPQVQSVAILRNRRVEVKGKSGNGGFIALAKGGGTWRSPSGRGAQMFERIGKGRKALRLLLGPSLSDMVMTSVTYNPAVIAYLDDLDNIILNDVISRYKK